MSLDAVIQWFASNPKSKPSDLPDEIAFFMRASHTGQIVVPIDFYVKFYCLALEKQNKPFPKGPEDFSENFMEEAVKFFSYAGDRCIYSYLKKEEICSYEDQETPLLESDTQKELKAEVTEKGNEKLKKMETEFNKAIEEQKKEEEKKKSPIIIP